MGCFSKFDVAGCGCECAVHLCDLPGEDLSIAYLDNITSDSGSGVLQYNTSLGLDKRPGGAFLLLPAGPCTWQASFVTAGGATVNFAIGLVGGCTYYSSGGGGTMDDTYDNPSGCSGVGSGPGTMTLVSSSCSPVNIVFRTGIAPHVIWTVTL
jgi:hypothetical protein